MAAMPDYILSSRRIRNKRFIAEPGPTRFLKVPRGRNPAPQHGIPRRQWLDEVMAAGHTGDDEHSGEPCGDIAVFVHGYNTSPADAVRRQRRLAPALAKHGFDGVLVGYDWPSADKAINYLEDRIDAKLTAFKLVGDGIALLAAARFRHCRYNVHLIAHSMGAYVVREAFDDADDRPRIASSNWTVSQLCLVAADVSSQSLSRDDARSRSLYRHSNRVTNYHNPYDTVLKLSDIKRVGVAPRAGRHGLPADAPVTAVDVNCGTRHAARRSSGNGHTWYFDDPVFIADLARTLSGDTEASVTAKRRLDETGRLHLA